MLNQRYDTDQNTPSLSIQVSQSNKAIRLAAYCVYFFINDILNHINSNIDGSISVDDIQLCLFLFADDAAVFTQDPRSLQLIPNDIEQNCNIWKLELNVNKIKIMIFEKGRDTNYIFFS